MQILALIFLHHVGDLFQPNWLIEHKKKHLYAHWEHAVVWGGIVSLGLYIFGLLELWKILFLVFVHASIDIFFYLWVKKRYTNYNMVLIDQALHYLQILTVYYV